MYVCPHTHAYVYFVLGAPHVPAAFQKALIQMCNMSKWNTHENKSFLDLPSALTDNFALLPKEEPASQFFFDLSNKPKGKKRPMKGEERCPPKRSPFKPREYQTRLSLKYWAKRSTGLQIGLNQGWLPSFHFYKLVEGSHSFSSKSKIFWYLFWNCSGGPADLIHSHKTTKVLGKVQEDSPHCIDKRLWF